MISISIIIPIYNVEKYIQRCLKSVMIQDVSNAEVECIVVDDCGHDNSMAIARQMIVNYQGPIRFEIVSHDKNRGLSAARNTGVFHATGDFVFFVDSDDYLKFGSLHYFFDNLKNYPDVDMIIGNVKTCKSGDILIRHIETPWFIDDCNVFFRRMLRHQIYLYAWNKLIRRKILLTNNILFEEGILFEDQCWSYELFSHLSSILLLPDVTYIYENNPSSIVNTAFTVEKGEQVLNSYTISVNKMLNNPPVYNKYRWNMTVDYLLFMMNFLMNGIDIHSRCPISSESSKSFFKVRLRILYRSIRHGRFMLSCFFMLLFSPFSYLQKFRMFRHHYYDIESMTNRICHLTDFIHPKF